MKPLPVIASLLVATAGAFVCLNGKNNGTPASPPPSTLGKTSKRPERTVDTSARLIASIRNLGQDACQDRIRALSDADLQRLTQALIAEHLTAADDTSRRASIPLLTLLAMESGHRDLDGFRAEIDEHLPPDSQIILDLKLGLHCAAITGLAEADPQRAVTESLAGLNPFVPTFNTFSATREAIFRAWARMNPDAAWQDVSANLENGEALPIQGILAEIKDPVLRASILDHVSKLVESAPRFRSGIRPGNTNQVNGYELTVSTALGLAEQDPDAAWEWIKDLQPKTRVLKEAVTKASPLENDEVPILEDLPIIGRLFRSQTHEFLREWAVRQPEQAKAFLDRHADTLSPPDQLQLACGLIYRDPVSAMDALPAFADPAERLDCFSRLIKTFPPHSKENAWPVLPYLNETLSRAQALATTSENLSHLHLPSDLEARALQVVRSAQEALENQQN